MKKDLSRKNLNAIKKYFNGGFIKRLLFGEKYQFDIKLHNQTSIRSVMVSPRKAKQTADNTFIFDGEYFEKGLLEETIIGQSVSGKRRVNISCPLPLPTW
tara:strand:+ start:629 stop:928 length:300 start_codon:yes stop_codon:yes gene_type:complete